MIEKIKTQVRILPHAALDYSFNHLLRVKSRSKSLGV
jgi:hypothetical protein